MTCVYLTVDIINDKSTSDLYIILVWVLYFTLLSFPAYYSWSFIGIFFPNMSLILKGTIMIVCIIIPILYLITSLADLWFSKSKAEAMNKKIRKGKA